MSVNSYCFLMAEYRASNFLKGSDLRAFYFNKLFGYDSWVALYDNGEDYPTLCNEEKGLRVEFIHKGKSITLDTICYLWKNSKRIGILELPFCEWYTYLYVIVYRLRNKNGKAMLYSDFSLPNKVDKIRLKKKNRLRYKVYQLIIRKCFSLCFAETTEYADWLTQYWNIKFECILPCLYQSLEKGKVHEYKKENRMLCVSRHGTEQKNSELLIESFEKYMHLHDYKLVLVGTATNEFNHWLDRKCDLNPNLKERIEYLGFIGQKEVLCEQYRRAKICILPSRWESFGYVLKESMDYGCYILATPNVPSMKDLYNEGKFGAIYDETKFAEGILYTIRNVIFNEQLCDDIIRYISNKFNNVEICEFIKSKLEEKNENGTNKD